MSHDADTGTTTNPLYTTSFTYNGLGQLVSSQINDGRPRTVTFTLDEAGQVIGRDEADGLAGGDPRRLWHRFAGREMLANANDSDPAALGYGDSIADRQVASPAGSTGAFRNGAYTGASVGLLPGIEMINSYGAGSAGGSYTVRGGDTLAGIAASLYGDASLWYKLAEANGLSAQSGLIEGQALILPAGVVRSTHNAGTFKPYDPNQALGDLSPTSPQPQKKGNKCGVLGMILLTVVAVAVTVVTSGAALAATTSGMGVFGAGGGIATVLGGGLLSTAGIGSALAIGAVSGAVGSIASQAVGVATGIQDKFSWKGVGLAALGGAVGAFSGGSNFAQRFVNGAINNATVQGIATATGLQSKFSWAGVAAAGVGAGVGGEIAGSLDGSKFGASIGQFGSSLVVGASSAIANAATRSAIEGSSFGDNIRAAIPDVIGSAIGNAVARGVAGRPAAQVNARPVAHENRTTGEGASIVVNQDYLDSVFGGGVGSNHLSSFGSADPLSQTGAVVFRSRIIEDQRLAYLVELGLEPIGINAGTGTEAKGYNSLPGGLTGGGLTDFYLFGKARDFTGFLNQNIALYSAYTPETMALDFLRSGNDFQMRSVIDRLRSVSADDGNAVFYAKTADILRGHLDVLNARGDAVIAQSGVDFLKYTAMAGSAAGGAVGLGFTAADTYFAYRDGELDTTNILGSVLGAKLGMRRLDNIGAIDNIGATGFGGAYASNGELVQSIATRADKWGIRNGMGSGPVVGTAKHVYADRLLTRYQGIFGDRGLSTEVRYIEGRLWERGMSTKGSVRLDVVEGVRNPTAIWDYKFGNATLSPSRVQTIQSIIPNSAKIHILQVKP